MRKAMILMVCICLLLPLSAAADTFTLWDNFPQTENGELGFFAARHNESTNTATDLDYVSDYNFSGAGVVVQRVNVETGPWISLLPSATESAVFYGIPDAAYSLRIYGQFALAGVATSSGVTIGKVSHSDPGAFTLLFHADLISTNPTSASFDFMTLIDSNYTLVFDVAGGQANLEGTIEATAVPVPASLLLLGSGLLGLAGWRRRPWLK